MADFCKTCKHCDTVEYYEPCFSCRSTGGGIPTKWEAKANCKPQTNADRIRAMSDEELAELLGGMCKIAEQCDDCPLDGKCPGGSYDCGSWDEWLKQPAEEE